MDTINVLAFDLGASSGRGMLARFDGKKITLEEIHRFPHNFSVLNGHAYWNIISLYEEMKKGMRLCREPLAGVGFDTWGVDCGLLDAEGNLVGMPGSYRDAALDDDNMNKVLALLGGSEREDLGAVKSGERYVFEKTGIACLAYNTLYKLCYLKEAMPEQWGAVDQILFMPNLIEYLFSGVKHSEYSIASTSQLLDMKEKKWAVELMEKAGLDPAKLAPLEYAGKDLGPLRPEIAKEVGQENLHILSVSGHDTACAVAAVPAREKEFTFLSSGTWSLMGISSETMLTGEQVIRDKISNEGTWDGGYRPTVNIIGLWMNQELRRCFQRQGKDYSFAQMNEMAAAQKPLQSFIRPDDFMQPGDYPEKIRSYCAETGQPVPESDGALVRCVLESLAMRYRQVYQSLRPYITWEEKLYIVGGGAQNQVLNQFTANALGIPVITGASEATAVGNVMEQLYALGAYKTREEKCDILAASFETAEYLPKDTKAWEEAYQRFEKLY
ncbi:MAG: FGGY-family carbohydrate kinase [Lachnospiraceae bacterium]|nr:FGGY-family carbohydrate kinase [Lachnospiraceae bacterium]